jgi:hypothetical protein
MTTYPVRALLAVLALGFAAFGATAINAVSASASEYCVYATPTYYEEHPITPAAEACVPAP